VLGNNGAGDLLVVGLDEYAGFHKSAKWL